MGQRQYPRLKRSEVEAILNALGFKLKNQEGSHCHHERPADGKRPRSVVTVDVSEREFGEFLLRSMIRQSNFSRDEFYGATRRTATKASVKIFRLSPTEGD
jgi:predicted RNA binding protein YcfA (HicA-like mRNA interferase family)